MKDRKPVIVTNGGLTVINSGDKKPIKKEVKKDVSE
jgi:hypothetical protein